MLSRSSSWTTKQITVVDREVNESVTFTKDVPKANITLSHKQNGMSKPSMMIYVYGDGDHAIGGSCTITTSASETTVNGVLYRPWFVGWQKNGSHVSSNEEYTFTVTGNETYVAVWSWQ